ncbi:MAG TPA: Rieske 2Fe-2S domain-containing protein [Azonexus sp.]|nr:Rieske 2Fe-2S domain-containing protein [Azonexus sp.]
MVTGFRLICPAGEVAEAGKGVRFTVSRYGREVPAFVIRFQGRVHAYINECGHVPAELDWQPGEFFDDSKLYLICSIHGALYAPESGRCLGGRCQGKGLRPLRVQEIDGQIFLEQETNHG